LRWPDGRATPITRTLTAAFDYFGARATNVRWGWAAKSPDGSVVVITLWSDQIMRADRHAFPDGAFV